MSTNKQRYLWLGIASLLSFFIGSRWNMPLAAWIAAVLLLRFFRSSEKLWRDAALAWLTTTIPTIIAWHGATSLHFIHPLAEVGLFLITAPIGLIAYIVDRGYYRRYGSHFLIMLVYPIAATAIDFFSSGSSPFGSFGAAGYSQRDLLPVMQIAAFTGIWGIGFVIAWAASLVNYVWDQGFRLSRPVLAMGAALALLLGLGYARTIMPAQNMHNVRIAGFSLPNGYMETTQQLLSSGEQPFRQSKDALHAQQLAQIRILAKQGAQIVVLQEGAIFGYADQVQSVVEQAGKLAQEEHIYIVLPSVTIGKQPFENIVRIIAPDGRVVLEHVKYGGNQFEGSLKGDGILRSVDTPYGRLSAIICWDADFQDVLRQAGQQQVDLLFIPSNDWREVKDIHAGMATFRAVENGMSIFRQTGQGVSVATDMYGRVIERVDSYAQQESGTLSAIHSAEIPVGSAPTLYPQIGDIFGSAMQLGLLGLILGLLIQRPWQYLRSRVAAT